MNQHYVNVNVNMNIVGKYLSSDVYTSRGNLIVPKDTLISEYIVIKLQEFGLDKVSIYNINTTTEEGDYKNPSYYRVKEYVESVELAKLMLQELASGKKFDFNIIENISHNIYNRINDCSSLIDCISTLKRSDEYTYTHLINVSVYSMYIAKWMDLSKNQIKDVIEAGLLHDVGKTMIPNEILNKPAALNAREFDIMKKHTVYGYDMIKDNKDISMLVKEAVLMHHEKENGTGYPFGINGQQKNFYAKIITVADVFDAITSKRVYAERQTPFEAFKEIEKDGFVTIDPRIMLTLFSYMPNNYIGAKVKLNNGEVGEVVYVPVNSAYSPIIKANSIFYDFMNEKRITIKEFI